MKPLPALLAVALLLASVAGVAVPASGGESDVSVAPSTETAVGSDAESFADTGHPVDAPRAALTTLEQSEAFTNVLTVGEPRRANATRSKSNLSAALSLRAEGLESELDRRSVREKLARMNDTDRKQRYIRHAIVELEIRSEELRAEEQAAYRLHNEERISTRQLLVRLARVDRRAERLSKNATMFAAAAEDVEGLSVNSEIGVLRLELRTLRGPVRDRVDQALRGDAPPTRVYAQTADDGVVLAAVVDGEYVREVYDGTRRGGGDSRIPVDRIGEVLQDGYPLIYDRANGMFSTLQDQRQASPTFGAEMEYANGRVLAYIDRSSARVFREVQTVQLNQSPPTEPRTVTQSNLELTVYPSYSGGPMLVEVADARTGEPVRANVTFTTGDGSTRLIGEADARGRLWAVMPNESVRVRTIHPSRSYEIASVMVSPADPRKVRADDNTTAPDENESGADPNASGGPASTSVGTTAPTALSPSTSLTPSTTGSLATRERFATRTSPATATVSAGRTAAASSAALPAGVTP
ncbi:hypothetical protein ACFO0N_16545 [Halobium salinum]|uniref:Uncharacterized protein n=1 Tax=Halobium salinum TaxID=1364940 RepID=A0ABD5PFN7_9EURY|nr:hypothetical protein [Halobium salinum]